MVQFTYGSGKIWRYKQVHYKSPESPYILVPKVIGFNSGTTKMTMRLRYEVMHGQLWTVVFFTDQG